MIRLGHTYTGIPCQFWANGTPSAPDSITAVLYRNGTATAVPVTLDDQTGGLFHASFTSDAGWAEDDHLVVRALAVQDGDEYPSIIFDSVGHQWSTEAVELDSATSDQLDRIEAAIGGSGSGARTVTITVNDGTTVLQNATVRLTEGANTFIATTNVSGVAVFNLDDATYTVALTKSGYSYAGTTLVVNGTETATYSMTQVSITPPSNPSLSAIVVLCLDAAGQPEADVDIDIRIVTVPSGSTNIAYKGAKQTATSDADGIARFEVVQGSVCEWKRGKADVWSRVVIDSDEVTNVTSVIGSP